MWKLRLVWLAAAMAAVSIAVVSMPQARAAIEDAMSCAQSTPCLEWDNSGSGDALKGVSKGNAVHGQTKFKSAGKPAGKAGVFGEDLSSTGNLNAGVLGSSTNGTGVIGTSTTYNAVQGLSAISTGVYGQSAGSGGLGVAGRNISTTHSNNGAGVLADGGPADDGLHAFANGTGVNAVYAFSAAGTSLFANQGASAAPELYLQHTQTTAGDIIQAVGPSGDVFDVSSDGSASLAGNLFVGHISDQGSLVAQSIESAGSLRVASGGADIKAASGASVALNVTSGTSDTESSVFTINNSSGVQTLTATDKGDVFVSGLYFSQGFCNSGCVVGNKQVHSVGEYAPTETEPTIEDNGEAALVDGVANVEMDQKFVNVIDPAKEYLVSVTPEGDCEGLFVASRGPNGFVVRELRHGHHSLSFEYRIVAKRSGVDAPRLPMTDIMTHQASPHPVRRPRAAGVPPVR
ncbi:MAG TPA: hypothetical protein VID24_02160 [Candidatus Eremiobacteraceae bacterium]